MSRRTLTADQRQSLGANLVEARVKAGFPQQGDAARNAGMQQTLLSAWENGRRTPDADGLIRLAVAYNCPLDDFFGGVDERYDEIIERRIPVNLQQHYQARIDTFIRRTTAAMQLALEPGALAPTPTATAAAPVTAAGKSASTRVRRPTKKNERRRASP